MLKKLLTLVITLCMLFSLTACTADIDGRHKGLSIGFNYTGPRYYEIMSAVRSDKQVFDIDNVTLDLYFGWFGPNLSEIENGNSLHLAFYITTSETGHWIDPQPDYYNVKNQYFITEVREFDTKVFSASQTKSKGKIFNYSEKITIPQEVFKNQEGVLELYTQIIVFSNENNFYYFDYKSSGTVKIAYAFIDDNTVCLSK